MLWCRSNLSSYFCSLATRVRLCYMFENFPSIGNITHDCTFLVSRKCNFMTHVSSVIDIFPILQDQLDITKIHRKLKQWLLSLKNITSNILQKVLKTKFIIKVYVIVSRCTYFSMSLWRSFDASTADWILIPFFFWRFKTLTSGSGIDKERDTPCVGAFVVDILPKLWWKALNTCLPCWQFDGYCSCGLNPSWLSVLHFCRTNFEIDAEFNVWNL